MHSVLSIVNKILDIDQTVTGHEYLKALAKNISQQLNVKYVLIGHPLANYYKEIQTDVVWAGDDYLENFVYELEHTPCENVLSGNRVCIHEEDVANLFPKDLLLTQMGVESYVGAPVTRAKENGMSGLLVLLDDKPMKDTELFSSITEFLALRASAEIEKFRMEETLTHQVDQKTVELNKTIEDLQQTQNKLIESEKMASLGSLVAGVAHEINTPLGIGLTGISHFIDISKDISTKYQTEDITKEEFEEYLSTTNNLARQINNNLNRINKLVNIFKQLAADRQNDEKRKFNIKNYINNILSGIKNISNNKNIKIKFKCEDIEINSYAGAYAQIITALMENSYTHAYEDKNKGTISINIFKEKNQLHIVYKDDGEGIEEKNLSKIFEPFFTTNREYGSTGLGLNIIYNIITSNLHGSIHCKSQKNHGTEFNISVPLS